MSGIDLRSRCMDALNERSSLRDPDRALWVVGADHFPEIVVMRPFAGDRYGPFDYVPEPLPYEPAGNGRLFGVPVMLVRGDRLSLVTECAP